MKCPECEKAGLKSTIYDPGGGFSTAMFVQRYYDEDGKLHIHDPNYTSVIYECSNGHEWDGARKNKCPSCDYEGGGSYTALRQKWVDEAQAKKGAATALEPSGGNDATGGNTTSERSEPHTPEG